MQYNLDPEYKMSVYATHRAFSDNVSIKNIKIFSNNSAAIKLSSIDKYLKSIFFIVTIDFLFVCGVGE